MPTALGTAPLLPVSRWALTHWAVVLWAVVLWGGTASAWHGPDVIVGDLISINNYGSQGSTYAYSVGTESCNIGDEILLWESGTNLHPVIPQDMFKLHEGRFTHIGASWLKHGFCALSLSHCDPCQTGTGCSALGIGCSDPYGAGLNGNQGNLGPRSQVNAFTGEFQYPFTAPPFSGNIARRVQVDASDLNPALNAGALYFVSSHYVTQDDAQSGNGTNNASYRRVTVGSNPTDYPLSFVGPTQQQQPPIQAWQDFQPTVTLVDVTVPGEGLFIVGYDVIDNGNGTWRYEYAVFNMNSDRSARSFSVPIPNSAMITDVEFHDIEWHSGEPYSTVDWTPSVVPGDAVSWSTEDFATNQNANAIRWSMLFNFSFVANLPPAAATGTVGLFKPGNPGEISFPILAPEGLPQPGALTCTQPDPATTNVDLGWVNNGSYDSITVERDGTLLATLPGTATSFTDVAAGYGEHTYGLTATSGVDVAEPTLCVRTVRPLPPSVVTCTQTSPGGSSVEVTWSAPVSYDSVVVSRAGTTIATLPGSASSTVDVGVPFGTWLYEVHGVISATSSFDTECQIQLGAASPLAFTISASDTLATYDPVSGNGAFQIAVSIEESAGNLGFPNDVTGFSFGLACDAGLLAPVSVTPSAAVATTDFFQFEVLATGVSVGTVIDFQNVETIAFGAATDVASVGFETLATAFVGENGPVTSALSFVDGLGSGVPVTNLVVVGFDPMVPSLVGASVTLDPGASGLFRRSDTNADGSTDVADAVNLLDYLFTGGTVPCLSSADTNDDAQVNIADAISILNYLFVAGDTPPAPFPDCGVDPTPDGVPCDDYPAAC